MKTSHFNAFCPFEIGDRIINHGTGQIQKITDIACTHYVKSGKVVFTYELDNSGRYMSFVQLPAAGKGTEG